MYEYLITYGGGIGPNVWDAEITVEAKTIREALDKAEKILDADEMRQDYVIFSIEEMD